MKKALSFLPLFFFIHFCQAQFRVAIIGGLQNSSIIETNSLPGWDSISKNYSSRVGIHAGFMADLQITPKSNLYFQPAVVFYNRGRKYDALRDSTVVFKRSGLPDSVVNTKFSETRKQYLNYVDIPLNLVYKFPIGKARFFLGGGPYFSIFYNGFDKKEKVVVDVNHSLEENNDLPVGKKPGQYQIMNFGVNAVAGIEFGKVFLSANYGRGLNNFYNSSDDASLKHEVIGGTIGIFLGQAEKPEPRIRDKDGDGISDDKDACPNEAGTAATNGCPDKDADGIADKDDHCPDTPGLIKYSGCPIPDTDKDGINDEMDKCPTVAGTAKYNGCPVPDTDSDGINDDEDKCPTVAGVTRYNGCPVPDTDSDGINDEEDKCPTVAGVKENAGCPEVKKELVEKVNFAAKRIQFAFAKSDLLPESFKVLDEVVSILNQNPELKLSIDGHTSSDGHYDINMALSQHRADNVKKYLITKGIDPSRLQATGFGPNKPLNDGKTEAEKALNRRVELKLSNQ